MAKKSTNMFDVIKWFISSLIISSIFFEGDPSIGESIANLINAFARSIC